MLRGINRLGVEQGREGINEHMGEEDNAESRKGEGFLPDLGALKKSLAAVPMAGSVCPSMRGG